MQSNCFKLVFLLQFFLWQYSHGRSDIEDFKKFKDNGLLTMSQIAVDMSNAGVLGATPSIKEKLTQLAVVVDEVEKEIELSEKDERDKDLIGNIYDILSGLEVLTNGIHRGSWQELVLGGLEIAVPLATMADLNDPLTEVILSLVSSVFDTFGGSTGGEIKTERMIQRIILFALDRANATQLDLDVSSTKRLYSSLSNNILQLRDGGSINKNQAMEFFNQAFEEMAIFGKVEEVISSSCYIGDITKYEDENELNEQTEKCLEFLNLYSSLSIIRQLLITDMASLVGEAGLNSTSLYLLKLVRKKQEINKNILNFIVDPINFIGERYAVSYFYASPERWPTLKAYIHRLDVMTNGKYLRAHVIVCSKQQLQGECFQMMMGKYTTNDLMGWRSSISSIYIGGNLKVTGFDQDKFKGTTFGPFIGPTVIGTIPGRNEWESMYVLATKKDASRYLRVCEEKNLRQKSPCDMLPMGLYKRLDDVHNNDWSSRINSISIPANMKVTAYDDFNFQGSMFGPLQGPDTIGKLCHSGEWKSLKLERTTKKPSEMIRICREENFDGYCDLLEEGNFQNLSSIHGCSWNTAATKLKSMRIPAGLRVYLWSEDNYDGLPLGPYTGPSLVRLVDGAETQRVIRSLKIKQLY